MSIAPAMPRYATAIAPHLPAGPIASIGLHVLLGALLLFSPLRPMPVPPVQPIDVELVTPQDLAVSTAPAPSEGIVVPNPAPLPPEPVPDAASGGTITAKQFYAAGILRQPDMTRIRRELTGFADAERISQLCIIEGMEQIRLAAPQYEPDVIVPYAMTDLQLDGLSLIALGGAFRSRRQWYEVAFRCTVSADYEGVEAFSFRLGALIPASEWEAHSLNASDENEPE